MNKTDLLLPGHIRAFLGFRGLVVNISPFDFFRPLLGHFRRFQGHKPTLHPFQKFLLVHGHRLEA